VGFANRARLLKADRAKAKVAELPGFAHHPDTAEAFPDLTPIGFPCAGIGSPYENIRGCHAKQIGSARAARLEQVGGVEHVFICHEDVVHHGQRTSRQRV
jgi:hypothetical protein